MALPDDVATWFDVQIETLKRVHSSWLPAIPIELLAQARKLPLGRRWLAKRLTGVSPLLFGLPDHFDSESSARLKAASWIGPFVAEPLESALDLGSLAMASTLRSLVNTPEIAKIRSALGPERFARVLAFATNTDQSPPAAPAAGDVDMVERIIRCGARELAALADYLHPAWGESVRLTYEQSWWFDASPASLTPEAAATCLRLRSQPPKAALLKQTNMKPETKAPRSGPPTGVRH